MANNSPVLVVDDQPSNVKVLQAYLLGAGFNPLAAYSGEEALRLASTENPDVILLDIMMPGMDGFEVTRRLKASPLTQHIPVVLVTSLDGSDNRSKGLDAGAEEFLTKPVNQTELIARVRSLQRLKLLQDELDNRKEISRQLVREKNDQYTSKQIVLIVEDEKSHSMQFCTILDHAGFETVVAKTAKAARKLVTQYMPNLILLDRLLPDCDGLDLLSEWKSQARFHSVPVIIMTAMTDINRKIEGIEYGADDYLIKPINNKELLARIRASLRRGMMQQKLLRDIDRLKADTITDRLTGIRNRQYLDADIEYRFAQVVRNPQRIFSLVMIDIDYFKRINDEYGHLMGDLVLRRVAQCLQETARSADIVTRYGGEEFCVVLPDTNSEEAQNAADRMCRAIAEYDFDTLDGKRVTISLGVSTSLAADNRASDMLARADAALYQAKDGGRNRVVAQGSDQLNLTKKTA